MFISNINKDRRMRIVFYLFIMIVSLLVFYSILLMSKNKIKN